MASPRTVWCRCGWKLTGPPEHVAERLEAHQETCEEADQ